jgi:hypothetical protein
VGHFVVVFTLDFFSSVEKKRKKIGVEEIGRERW